MTDFDPGSVKGWAENPTTGARLALIGDEWKPAPYAEDGKGNQVEFWNGEWSPVDHRSATSNELKKMSIGFDGAGFTKDGASGNWRHNVVDTYFKNTESGPAYWDQKERAFKAVPTRRIRTADGYAYQFDLNSLASSQGIRREDAAPDAPTDPTLNALTGGGDQTEYQRALADENFRRRVSDTGRRASVATGVMPWLTASGQQIASIPEEARSLTRGASSYILQKVGVSKETARKLSKAVDYAVPAFMVSASTDEAAAIAKRVDKDVYNVGDVKSDITAGQKVLEEKYAPEDLQHEVTDPVTGKKFKTHVKDIITDPVFVAKTITSEMLPMAIQASVIGPAAGASHGLKGLGTVAKAMVKDPRIFAAALSFNAGRIMTGEYDEAINAHVNKEIERRRAAGLPAPTEAEMDDIRESAAEYSALPVAAVSIAQAPIETLFEASAFAHVLEGKGVSAAKKGLGGVAKMLAERGRSVAGAALKEGVGEGIEELVGAGIKKLTYKPKQTWYDTLRDTGIAFGGGVAAGGAFDGSMHTLQTLASISEGNRAKAIKPEMVKAANEAIEKTKMDAEQRGDEQALLKASAAQESLSSAKTVDDVVKAVVPMAAFGKSGIELEQKISTAEHLAEKHGDAEAKDELLQIRAKADELITKRADLIAQLNEQENQAADIEDIDAANAVLSKIKKEKGRVEQEIKKDLAAINEQLDGSVTKKLASAADAYVTKTSQEIQETAQSNVNAAAGMDASPNADGQKMSNATDPEERANAILGALSNLDISALPQREQAYINIRLGEIENRMANHARLVSDVSSTVHEGRKASKHVMRVAETKKGQKRFSRSIGSALDAEGAIALVDKSISETASSIEAALTDINDALLAAGLPTVEVGGLPAAYASGNASYPTSIERTRTAEATGVPTDIVSPSKNPAFEGVREAIRSDETLTPQQKNEAIRKAYDEAKGNTVYHGSRAQGIERFESQQIGSGEGTAGEGWGLYLSGDPAVADYYREQIGGDKGGLYQAKIPAREKFINADAYYGDQSKQARAGIDKTLYQLRGIGDISETIDAKEDMLGFNIYKDVSRALGQAEGMSLPENVLDAIDEANATDGEAKSALLDKAASLLFSANGVPGITYTDDSTGVSGAKANNYVLFDPESAQITGAWSNLKAVLKEIGDVNKVNDISSVVANFYKLTDAIVRDLADLGKLKFEAYWKKFSEYVDAKTLERVEKEHGWEARNAYAEAAESLRFAEDADVANAGTGPSLEESSYSPASYFAEGIDGVRGRIASVTDGHNADAGVNAASMTAVADAVLFGDNNQTHVDEHGMGTIYTQDGDTIIGVSENGGIFKVVDLGDGKANLEGVTGPKGQGLATMAAAASLAQKLYGATEMEGYVTSVGAWMRRGVYPSTTFTATSPDIHTTSISDMVGKIVDRTVSPDVLMHGWNALQNGDSLGAYLAFNVAKGQSGEVEFMHAGLDPFRMADQFVMDRNEKTGEKRQTLSQYLGIDIDRSTPGDYYWGLMRAIKKLGSTQGETSIKLRTKFALNVDAAKNVAEFMHSYKPKEEIRPIPKSALYTREDGVDKIIHATEVGMKEILGSMNQIDEGIAKGITRYGSTYFDASKVWSKGDPSGGYKYSPMLWVASPAVISMRDSSMRRVYDVGKAFTSKIERVRYSAREGLHAATELDQSPEVSRVVQRALVDGTLWEWKNDKGEVTGQGKVWSDVEMRERAAAAFPADKMLQEKVIDGYRDMRIQTDMVSQQVKTALKYQHDVHVAKLEKSLATEPNSKIRSQIRGEIIDLNKNFKEMLRSTFGNAAYWPVIREGKYKFEIQDMDGNRLAVPFVENTDAVSIKEAVRRAAYDSPAVYEAVKQKAYTITSPQLLPDLSETRALGGAIFDGSMAAWMAKASALDPEYAAKMRELVAAASVGDTFKQRTKHRSGVPGWTHKAGVSYQHFVSTASNMIANAYHAHEFATAMEGMGVDVRGGEYDPNMEKYARDYVNDVRNPPFSNWASNLTTLSYAWELMGNNVFAFVNKLQPWLVGMPRIGALYGYKNAAKALGTAEQLVWRHTLTQLGFKSFEDLSTEEATNIIERIADRKNFRGYKNAETIAENVRYALMRSIESGDLRPSLNMSLMAEGETNFFSRFGTAKDKVMEYTGFLQNRSEQMNRIQTIVATAIIASEHGVVQFDDNGVFNTKRRDSSEVARLAEYTNDIVNMTSGRANSPLTTRMSGNATGWGRVAFQYKRMLFDMVGAMHNLGLMNARGAESRRQAVWEYAKPWMAEMIAGVAFAGPKATVLSLGLLGAGKMLVSAICAAWDWPEEEVYNAASDRIIEVWSNFYQTQLNMSKETADQLARQSLFTMMHGATNANGYGFDISNSITPQLMMIPNNAKVAEVAGSALLGAAGSRIGGVADELAKYGFNAEGFKAAGAKAIPRAATGAAEVFGLKTTQTGETRGVETALRVAGFKPTRQAMNQEILSNRFELSNGKKELLTRLKKIQHDANLDVMDAEGEEAMAKADKNMDEARSKIDKLITDWNLKVDRSKVGDKAMRINYQRDVRGPSRMDRRQNKNESLEGWQK